MKFKTLKYILFFVCLGLSCSNQPIIQSNNQNNETARNQPAGENKTPEKQDAELQKQLVEIAAAAQGKVGVSATILETGQSVSLNGQEHFPMQSVYKLPIAMVILKQIDDGKFKLDQKVRVEKSDFVRQGQHSPIRDQNPDGAELTIEELLKFSVSESDGTASDVLLKLAGGGEAVGAYLNGLGVSEIAVINSEKELGKDWETQYRNYAAPEAAVKLLEALYQQRGLSEPSRAFLLKIMIETVTGPKRLKGLLPANTIVAHKTGTSGTQNGITAATNDIGLITLPDGRHLAIAVFVSDSPANEETREATIARIAKAVWDKWGGEGK